MATIRPATKADLEAITDCARCAYERYVRRIGRKPAPMVADFSSAISRGHAHVLQAEGQVYGYVVCYPVADAMHLENVAIRPQWQGYGYGGQLIRFVEEHAREQGLAAVELYTNEKMRENQKLYPALGYLQVGSGSEGGFNRVYYRKTV